MDSNTRLHGTLSALSSAYSSPRFSIMLLQSCLIPTVTPWPPLSKVVLLFSDLLGESCGHGSSEPRWLKLCKHAWQTESLSLLRPLPTSQKRSRQTCIIPNSLTPRALKTNYIDSTRPVNLTGKIIRNLCGQRLRCRHIPAHLQIQNRTR